MARHAPVRTPQARLAALVVAAFVAVTVGVFALPAPVAAWDARTFSSTSESLLVRLTNQARASAGLRSLRVDSTLTSIARWRSKDMIQRDYFSHSIPGYGSVFDVLSAKGYCYRIAGENIGWNSYPDDVATEAIQRQFMASSGHRSNILGKAWDAVGIGAYKSASGKHMWTVIFADRCGGDTAVKPKPKATPRPAPRATLRPAPRATPRPTPKATPKPRPAPSATPAPSPTPASSPAIPREPDDDAPRWFGPGPGSPGDGSGGRAANGGGNGDDGRGNGSAAPGRSYRVDDPVAAPAAPGGFLDGLGSAILTFLFGA